MAAFNYAKAKKTAQRLLTRFGQTGTLVRTTTSGGDAWNPAVETETSYAALFAVTEWNKQDIDGTLILATDRKVILSAQDLDIEPSTADKIVIGGVAHEIGYVRPLSPAGTAVIYEIAART